MKRLGVRAQLTWWFVGVLLIILTFYTSWIGFVLWRNLEEALEHHLDEDYQFAVQMVDVRDGAVVWRGDADTDHGYQGGVRRWVEVYSQDGLRLFQRGSAEAEALQRFLSPPVLTDGMSVVETPRGRLRVRSGVIDLRGIPVIIRVARTGDAEWEDARTTVIGLVLGIPIGLLAAGAGGYLLARRALRPVAVMADRARRISAEQLHERLPVDNPHDELGQLATVVNDTFSRLEQSFEALKRFTADASHELRTPLTALRSVGEVGLADARSPREYQDIIGSMLEESSKLGRLVDGLLLLSRSDAGHTHLRRAPVDLAQEVRGVAGQLAVLAEEKGQTLAIDAPDAIEVAVDRNVCRHAIVNVLDNAIKYGPPGSGIRIAARRQDEVAQIDVSDEGPGVSVEHRERIFERFYRVERGDRPPHVTGSGLGLSIARWAVELHGGRLEYVAGQAKGACFRITLPTA